jgi:phospholipid N-methyltransferase
VGQKRDASLPGSCDPMTSDALAFLSGWSRNPLAVGLPFASSCWTARRLAQVALDTATPGGGPVLELGAGTGSVTVPAKNQIRQYS